MTRSSSEDRTAPPAPAPGSADAGEIARFADLAGDWWNPDGGLAPLHRINPARMKFIRDHVTRYYGRDPRAARPLAGLDILDIGCGGGLLAEPLARLGARVTGIDAAAENIEIAAEHAAEAGLDIDYRAAVPEDLAAAGAEFDVVANMEVVEHVTDAGEFLAASAALIRPGGVTVVATLNRTLKSLALAKLGAEYLLRWLPPGTHDWRKFVRPSELARHLRAAGLEVRDLQGITYRPWSGEWGLSADLAVNYLVFAVKAH